MMLRRNIIYLIFLFVSIVLSSCNPPNRTTSGGLFNVKDSLSVIPKINVFQLDGTPIDINSRTQNDQIKLVCIWATWCGPCSLEFNDFLPKYEIWKEKYNLEIIGISIDDERMGMILPSYVAKKAWPYEFFHDRKGALKKALKIESIPQAYLVDQKGKIVHINYAYHEAFPIELEAMLKELTTE